jgi:hypothetical protein
MYRYVFFALTVPPKWLSFAPMWLVPTATDESDIVREMDETSWPLSRSVFEFFLTATVKGAFAGWIPPLIFLTVLETI